MAFDGILITEIFHSIQGETSAVGLPFTFIRLTGCNLRCSYCDTAYAFKGGRKMAIDEVLETVQEIGEKRVLLTGGEPLIQRGTLALAQALQAGGFEVSIETHGEVSIEKFAPFCRIIMDIKTPSSGMSRGGFRTNLPWLKPSDEIKFVVASEEDYAWAREIVRSGLPTDEILFSPAAPMAPGAPGQYPGVRPEWLAAQILEDRLPVRMQGQLHKWIWGKEKRGV